MGTRSQTLMYPQDLRLRLVAVLGSLVAITLINQLWPAIAGAFCIIVLFALFRQPIPWRRLVHLEIFLLLLFITLPFSVPGTPFFQVGSLTASVEGTIRTLVLGCKVLCSIMLTTLFIANTDPLNLGMAMRSLYVPEKLVQLLIAVVRYLAVIQEEYCRLHDAMKMRAFTPRSTRYTWRCYGHLFGMVLVRAIERAERVEEAMRMRNFCGHYPRSPATTPYLHDWLALCGILIGAMLLALWDKL